MVRLLDKTSEKALLGLLFDMLYENMLQIAPEKKPYDEEREAWLACVGAALEKEPRQIALLYAGTELAGFCMYYVRDDLFMVEELQIAEGFRQTVLIAELFRFFARTLPPEATRLEAYADRRNQKSQQLMRKMGMESVEDGLEGDFLHFRGDMRLFHRKKQRINDT